MTWAAIQDSKKLQAVAKLVNELREKADVAYDSGKQDVAWAIRHAAGRLQNVLDSTP